MVRRDHVAGGAFVAAGALILIVSRDLPFGTLASPGAGMLPTLVLGLMILFGVILFARAAESPPMAAIGWGDLAHAARVVAVAAVAVAAYTTLGFILTMALLLFCLLYVIERRNLLVALLFSVVLPLVTYILFDHVLKTPLERGLLWF
jgi:hypothetical protein